MGTENDEINAKENYCNYWVLHSDVYDKKNSTKQTNTEETHSKSASYNNLNLEEPKSEEQLQREYLVNLLLQLQTENEQEVQTNLANTKHSKTEKCKKVNDPKVKHF